MVISRADDLELTELAREIHNLEASMQAHLRDGYLDAAFICGMKLGTKLDKLQWRLNDIKYATETK